MKKIKNYIELDVNDVNEDQNEIFEQLLGEKFIGTLISKGIIFTNTNLELAILKFIEIHYDFNNNVYKKLYKKV